MKVGTKFGLFLLLLVWAGVDTADHRADGVQGTGGGGEGTHLTVGGEVAEVHTEGLAGGGEVEVGEEGVGFEVKAEGVEERTTVSEDGHAGVQGGVGVEHCGGRRKREKSRGQKRM